MAILYSWFLLSNYLYSCLAKAVGAISVSMRRPFCSINLSSSLSIIYPYPKLRFYRFLAWIWTNIRAKNALELWTKSKTVKKIRGTFSVNIFHKSTAGNNRVSVAFVTASPWGMFAETFFCSFRQTVYPGGLFCWFWLSVKNNPKCGNYFTDFGAEAASRRRRSIFLQNVWAPTANQHIVIDINYALDVQLWTRP